SLNLPRFADPRKEQAFVDLPVESQSPAARFNIRVARGRSQRGQGLLSQAQQGLVGVHAFAELLAAQPADELVHREILGQNWTGRLQKRKHEEKASWHGDILRLNPVPGRTAQAKCFVD